MVRSDVEVAARAGEAAGGADMDGLEIADNIVSTFICQ